MKLFASTIFVLVTTIKESAQSLSITDNPPSFPASDCILYILKKYFRNISKLSIRLAPEHGSFVSKLLRKIDLPVIINADEIPKTREIDKRIPNQVCILMDETVNITSMLNRTLWTAQTQFILITSNDSVINETSIFQKFWFHNVNNVIILTLNNADVYIHSFVPYNKFDCNVHHPVLLAVWSSGVLINSTDIFLRPIKNLNGCPINVSVVHLPPTIMFKNKASRNGTDHINGIEATLFMEISKKLNCKPRFAIPRDGQAWGWIEPSPAGVVGEVFQRKSQIGFGLLASTLERYEYLDTSVPMSCNKECITWAVPLEAGKTSATWIAILTTEFPINVWCLMFVAGTSTVLTFRMLSKFSRTNQNLFQDNAEATLYVFRSFLGVAYKMPKDDVMRILLVSWLWYSFIVIVIYQSSMGSKLAVPLRKPDINTFRDLLNSDLHFTGFYNTFRLLLNADQEGEIKEIANRLEVTDYDLGEAIEKIISDRNIAYMREATTFMYNAMINPRAKGLVHIMKQCVYNYYPTMVFQKKFALTSEISGIIRRLFETGLICKWRSKYLYDVPQPPPRVIQLSIKHMKGSFLVLGIGIGMGLVVFCAEHIQYRLALRHIAIRNNYDTMKS